MKRRILMLGGAYFQVPAIKYAKSQGHYVVTCDYLPANPGHKYADEYHNVSTTDCEAVLGLARKIGVDGIVAYASDPAAPTAAFVANQLNLPSNPYDAVLTLARKDLFREYLRNNGFKVPVHGAYDCLEALQADVVRFKGPFVVKPVDSSGSKGVTIVANEGGLGKAFCRALEFSRIKKVIVEEYVGMKGFQVAGDGFVNKGELVFRYFGNEHFDKTCNPLVPVGESFPSVMSDQMQTRVHDEIQRLLSLLKMEMGGLNFDIRISKDEEIYLMEVGPRNGGNLIPDVTRYATGVDMIKYAVDSALGLDCGVITLQKELGYYSTYIVHSTVDGCYSGINLSEQIREKIIESCLWCHEGDKVNRFDGSNCTLGAMILKYSSMDEMLSCMENMNAHIMVQVTSR